MAELGDEVEWVVLRRYENSDWVTLAKIDAAEANIADNLQNVTSNIIRFGLLYKPKQPRPQQNPPYPGKSPIR